MVIVNANCDNDMLNDVDVIESLRVKEWCRGCGPRSSFLTSGQETASPFSFANATQRGRFGYGGTANTVRNREVEGGGR